MKTETLSACPIITKRLPAPASLASCISLTVLAVRLGDVTLLPKDSNVEARTARKPNLTSSPPSLPRKNN